MTASDPKHKYSRLMCDRMNERIHFSHLFEYVSAYELCPETLKDLETKILEAYIRLRAVGSGVEYVDMDGEMRLEICHGGQIRLMLPWKEFDMKIESSSYPTGIKKAAEMSMPELQEYLAAVNARETK